MAPQQNEDSHSQFPAEVIRVFLILQQIKDSLCVTPIRSHQSSLDSPSRFLKQYMALLATEFLSILQLQDMKDPYIPTEVVKDFLIPNSRPGFLIISSQGFIFPNSSQGFYYPQLSRIYFPQQYSKSAYMRIHYIHIS